MRLMAKEVTIKKIHLDAFIQALVNIYNSGADYIDIVAIPNTENDKIKIVVKDEYMSEEEEDEEDEQIEGNTDLSDLDLNELI